MSFMMGDRLTLDLEQYCFTFYFNVHNITILAFKDKNQCVLYRAVMAKRFACRSYNVYACPFLPLARAFHI